MFTGFAILKKNAEVIFFDSITRISESYSASISKHPLSTGSLITDHTTIDNVKFNVSGVLSDADFNLSRPTISSPEVNTSKQFVNDTITAKRVEISSGPSTNKLLTEVIAQFTKDTIPVATVTPQEKAKTARFVKLELQQMIQDREEFTFFEYDQAVVTTTYKNCVLTGLEFEENDTTGQGVFPNMSFEQVAYSVVKNITVKVTNKGRQTAKSSNPKNLPDANNGPTNLSTSSPTDYQFPVN